LKLLNTEFDAKIDGNKTKLDSRISENNSDYDYDSNNISIIAENQPYIQQNNQNNVAIKPSETQYELRYIYIYTYVYIYINII
jgi:hypothetical protein